MLKILLQEMNILNMLGWDFSVSPESLSTDFADYPDEILWNWGRAESAGINRHRVEGVSPLHERRSCSIMAPSHASAIREEAAKR